LVVAMPDALMNYEAAQAQRLIEWSHLFGEP
jgi:hypothetical protein